MHKKPSLVGLKKASDLETFINTGKLSPEAPRAAEPASTGVVVKAPPVAPGPVAPTVLKAVSPKTVASNEAGERKTSFNLDRDLHCQLKILAVKKNRKLQDLLTEAIKSYLKKNDIP